MWRETLLAKHVIDGKTIGYKNHPQLNRFRLCENAAHAIDQYLSVVFDVAETRGYDFDRCKVDWHFKPQNLLVTKGQMQFETQHLLAKLKLRDAGKYREFLDTITVLPHPLFEIVDGEIEPWERIVNSR